MSGACESDPGGAAGQVAGGRDDSQGKHDPVHAQVEKGGSYSQVEKGKSHFIRFLNIVPVT